MTFLAALLHPEPAQRLSIAELREQKVPATAWLHNTLRYKVNSAQEIGAEMKQRIYVSDSFSKILTSPNLT